MFFKVHQICVKFRMQPVVAFCKQFLAITLSRTVSSTKSNSEITFDCHEPNKLAIRFPRYIVCPAFCICVERKHGRDCENMFAAEKKNPHDRQYFYRATLSPRFPRNTGSAAINFAPVPTIRTLLTTV